MGIVRAIVGPLARRLMATGKAEVGDGGDAGTELVDDARLRSAIALQQPPQQLQGRTLFLAPRNHRLQNLALVEQVLHVPQRAGKQDRHRDGKADHLG